MFHCKKFRANVIWFLDSIEQFELRELRIGVCPQCGKEVAELIERRKSDNKIFVERYTGRKYNQVLKREKERVQYKSSDIIYNKTLYGWRYGLNTTIKINGKEINKQYAVDFSGNKELIKCECEGD